MEPITITLYVLGALVGLGALYFGISKLMGGSSNIGGEGDGKESSAHFQEGDAVVVEPPAELSDFKKYEMALRDQHQLGDDRDDLLKLEMDANITEGSDIPGDVMDRVDTINRLVASKNAPSSDGL